MIEIVSFGYGHAPAPDAHLTIDVRSHFRDPHINPAFRNLTVRDDAVFTAVRTTPGIEALIGGITTAADAYMSAPQPGPLTIAVGCVGGRHRSAAVAEILASDLRDAGHDVALVHRDIDRPVLEREAK